MTRAFLALIALLAFGGIGHAQKPTVWEPSYAAGYMDDRGNFVGGTEIRDLVPWNPGKADAKLYAGNGYWEDNPGPEGFQTAQVLVLNSSHGKWQQDVNFGDFCPKPEAPRCALATSTLAKLLFSKDETGAAVSVQVLVASTWDVRATKPVPINVYAKNNSDGKWHQTQLATAASDVGSPQVRSFATHVDTVTGQNWAFAGEAPTGIFHGLLSSTRGAGQNIIKWTTGSENVEFNTSSYNGPSCNGLVRVTSFAEVAEPGGKLKLYAAICFQIWVRVDGPQGDCKPNQVSTANGCASRWTVFWTDPTPSDSETGLRGLTKVAYNGNDVLLVGEEGGRLQIYRVDPVTAVGFAELDLKSTLNFNWVMDLGYGISAYSSMAVWYDESGTGRRLIGMETYVSPNTPVPKPDRSFTMLDDNKKMEGDGWYVTRNAAVSYQLVHIPSDLTPKQMVAIRAIAQSPFQDECNPVGNPPGKGCAIYFGGFDANKSTTATPCYVAPCTFPPLTPIPVHNTAWIVKGGSPLSLPP